METAIKFKNRMNEYLNTVRLFKQGYNEKEYLSCNGVSVIYTSSFGGGSILHCKKCGGLFSKSSIRCYDFSCPICSKVGIVDSDVQGCYCDEKGDSVATIKGMVMGKYLLSFSDGRNVRVSKDDLLKGRCYNGVLDADRIVADRYGCLRFIEYYDNERDIVYSRVNDDLKVYMSTYSEYVCGDMPGYDVEMHLRSSSGIRLNNGYSIIISKVLSDTELLACDLDNDCFLVLDRGDDAISIAVGCDLPKRDRLVFNEYKGIDDLGFPYVARLEDGELTLYYSDYSECGECPKQSLVVLSDYILEGQKRKYKTNTLGEYLGYKILKEEFRVGSDIYYKVKDIKTGKMLVTRICDIGNELQDT